MIVAVDTRRPASVGIEVALQLEAYLGETVKLHRSFRHGRQELPRMDFKEFFPSRKGLQKEHQSVVNYLL